MGNLDSFAFKVDSLSLSFQSKVVFKNINFETSDRQFIALLGPSGCGKTSLLRCLAGLQAASLGTIEFQAQVGSDLVNSKISKSFVFQKDTLLEWRNVYQNVALGLELQSLDFKSKEIQQKVLAALRSVGLENVQDLYPHQLSGGMRMRVALARALVVDPQILFMDEPFSALDEPTRERLSVELRELFLSRPMLIFFVTHSISEALFLADRVFVMQNGAIEEFPSVLPSKNRSLEHRFEPVFVNASKAIFRKTMKASDASSV